MNSLCPLEYILNFSFSFFLLKKEIVMPNLKRIFRKLILNTIIIGYWNYDQKKHYLIIQKIN